MDKHIDKPTCADCVHSLTIDHGYSNYTVEGSDFFCLIGKHPDDGFDAWYGNAKELAYAESCDEFRRGDGIHLDVDRDSQPMAGDPDFDRLKAWEDNGES